MQRITTDIDFPCNENNGPLLATHREVNVALAIIGFILISE